MALLVLLDNDQRIRRLLTVVLRNSGYEVLETGSPREALASLQSEAPGMLILDVDVPRREDGEAFLHAASEAGYHNPVLIISASPEGRRVATGYGAYFLRKPFDVRAVIDLIARLVPPPLTSLAAPLYRLCVQGQQSLPAVVGGLRKWIT